MYILDFGVSCELETHRNWWFITSRIFDFHISQMQNGRQDFEHIRLEVLIQPWEKQREEGKVNRKDLTLTASYSLTAEVVFTQQWEGPSSLFHVFLVIYTINSDLTAHAGVLELICTHYRWDEYIIRCTNIWIIPKSPHVWLVGFKAARSRSQLGCWEVGLYNGTQHSVFFISLDLLYLIYQK